MNMPQNIKSGFSFHEAILMTKFCQQIYSVYQYDDGNVNDIEIQEIYNSLYRSQDWKFVHSIRNDESNVRGFIAKKTTGHQYTVVFRGSIVTDRGAFELTDLVSDFDWDLVNYGSVTDKRIKVVQGFLEASESVCDQLEIFFKTLLGKLRPKDFDKMHQMTYERQFACITAIADAGAIRLGNDFELAARALIEEAVADEELGNDDELTDILDFQQSRVLALEELKEPVEVYVTGHSLGGSLAFLGANALRRYFGSAVMLKVYTIGAPKVGNESFANYYERQIGKGLTHRVENLLDIAPSMPLPPPFPLNMLAGNGLRVGNLYLSNCSPVGELHTVMGLGSQGVSVDFGGAVEFLGGIPFPHGSDAYLQLLEEDHQRWQQLWRPIRNIVENFMNELLEEQTQAIKEELDQVKKEIQGLKNHYNGKVEGKDGKPAEVTTVTGDSPN
ncbi:hypothetical protein BJP36_05215 [Moorena producens JHB]|uniref:Fungal lipase-type domain-containing protein n=1 Tax=Moorena producens (strain JHB) TaxID=1454205 RepID=A0A1D9FVM2_MOOP1|nr:hypothetical protein [Moorena producens]AOY79407.1 hypothetical protein BJP36_05215 [Moorena producens JHB]